VISLSNMLNMQDVPFEFSDYYFSYYLLFQEIFQVILFRRGNLYFVLMIEQVKKIHTNLCSKMLC